MKKLLSIFCAAVLLVTLVLTCVSCGSSVSADFKVGVILIGDENEGYTYAHISGIQTAAKELGMSESQIIWKYTIPEDEKCYDAAIDLVEQGCSVIFSNSYGHQSHMKQAAQECPDVTFVSMTGDQAATSGLSNYKNAFTGVYQSRYVAGVVAGMKLAELVADGKLTDANYDGENIKLGYVGAYPYAEVVSGYTAYYLGVKSVVENVTMQVTYTNSWFDITAEGTVAEALAADGCVIISQHADSTGAPAAVQALQDKGQVVYCVGYNVDMLSVAPNAALTSPTNNWAVYYKYAIEAASKGEDILVNWSQGYEADAVGITALGSACAAGTQEKVDEVVKGLKDGSIKVFDTSKFTVGGATLTEYLADVDGDFAPDTNAIWDGYFHESEMRSAPYFDIRIDGIVENNNN
ncbi:MAG: BMP family ABC transporter substrate-binding protein [Ruminococcaceae bacterium]|nr:BMP family ABC transporter substrate-binding protein [Oscillospiraceae bacterium]